MLSERFKQVSKLKDEHFNEEKDVYVKEVVGSIILHFVNGILFFYICMNWLLKWSNRNIDESIAW